jgi:hypothetical protein
MYRETTKRVQNALHRIGFRRTLPGQVRHSAFSSVILNVQKSSHGEDYFFNWAVFIHQLARGDISAPPTKLRHHDWHINMRLEQFLPEHSDPIERFAFFSRLSTNEKEHSLAAIDAALDSKEFKARVEKSLTESGIIELYKAQAFLHSLILKDARAFLETRCRS